MFQKRLRSGFHNIWTVQWRSRHCWKGQIGDTAKLLGQQPFAGDIQVVALVQAIGSLDASSIALFDRRAAHEARHHARNSDCLGHRSSLVAFAAGAATENTRRRSCRASLRVICPSPQPGQYIRHAAVRRGPRDQILFQDALKSKVVVRDSPQEHRAFMAYDPLEGGNVSSRSSAAGDEKPAGTRTAASGMSRTLGVTPRG